MSEFFIIYVPLIIIPKFPNFCNTLMWVKLIRAALSRKIVYAVKSRCLIIHKTETYKKNASLVNLRPFCGADGGI